MESPFNFTMAKLINVNGKLSKNFPPMANKIAKAIEPKKITFLKLLDIFLDGMFAIDFKRK